MSDTEDSIKEGSSGAPECFHVPLDALPDRLDKVLSRLLPQHSRNRLQTWITQGHVRVDGEEGRIRTRVGPGSRIEVWPQQAPEDMAFVPEAVEFEVVAQGREWIVINKPAGLVTHPGAGNWRGTLLNGLLFRYPELSQVARAGIVHRLDKDTSGLLVVARTDTAQTHLIRQLQARAVKREYCALVHGQLRGKGTVDAPLGRDRRVPVRMSVDRPVAPKAAVTHYQALRAGRYEAGAGGKHGHTVSEVICRLETGRTHQIRVHMASLRHPLMGDVLYGGRREADAGRQMLHARAFSFQDPQDGQWLDFQAGEPDDFKRVRRHIVWDGGLA